LESLGDLIPGLRSLCSLISGLSSVAGSLLVDSRTTEETSYLPLPLGEGWGEGLPARPQLIFLSLNATR
jgi:hypothetical protein